MKHTGRTRGGYAERSQWQFLCNCTAGGDEVESQDAVCHLPLQELHFRFAPCTNVSSPNAARAT